ncbi:CopD family protein, partial [Escherichia sp. TWPC-MK]
PKPRRRTNQVNRVISLMDFRRYPFIQALMRFSWCGHFAVIGVLASGVLNALLITGFPPTLTTYWGQLLLLKAIL